MKLADVATWPKGRGKKELLKHFNGEYLSPAQSILAKCYDCTVGYCDGKTDCMDYGCSHHPFMPYAVAGVRRRTRSMTDDQKHAAAERMKKVRRNKRQPKE
jgi:hypothetical protein